MVGDAVTMVITVNETVEANGIQIPVVTIASRTSTDGDVTIRNAANNGDASQGDLVFTANYTMQTDDTETDSIEFQVAFTDLAGNVGTAIASLINDRGVSFDKTSPDFTNTAISSSIHIESDNDYDDDGAIATVTDVITLTLTSAEALKTSTKPTVTILGVSANVSADGENKVFTATHTITGVEAGITNNQVIYFNVEAGYTDGTGNAGAAVTQAAASFENATLVSTDGTYVLYDKTAPVLDPVRIKSNNANDTTLAVSGNTIELTMVSDTPIRTGTKPTIQIAGNTIANDDIDRVSNLKFVATYAMQNNSNDNAYDDPDTKIPIRITTYDDAAGNTGDAVTNTSDPTTSYVIYDNTDPDLQQLTIASNQDDSDPSLAIPGSRITLQFIADEVIQEPTVTIVGRPPDELTGTNNNKTWTATIVMLEDDDDAVDPIPFSVIYADLAGNTGTAYDQTGTSDGSSISFDKTKPTLSAIYMRSESSDSKDSTYINPDNNISLRFKVSEPLAALDVYINNERGRFPAVVGDPITITKLTDWTGVFEKWKASYTITDATSDNDGEGAVIPFTIDFTDLNAYGGTQVSETTDDEYVTFDQTEPTVEIFTYLSNNGTTTLAKLGDDITASLTASELIQTPVMKISGTAVTEAQDGTDRSWTATHEMVADNDEGQIELSLVSFMDYAGNTGTARTTTTNDVYVTYDQTKPVLRVVSVASDNNYSSGTRARAQDVVTITLSTTDDDNAGEDIQEPTISMLGSAENVTITVGDNAKTWTATKTVVSTHDEGEVQFSLTYADLAGNSGAAAATAVAQDADGNVTVDLTKTDISSLTPDLVDGSDSGVLSDDDLTNETTPTFSLSGLTDAPVSAATDSIYIVVDTDTSIRSKVNSNEMTFTVPDAKAISNQIAAYSVTVVTKDLAGNLSDPSNALSLRVDTQAPDLVSALDLLKADDTGNRWPSRRKEATCGYSL
jgi:DNA-dependent RNA polymerase auxiliary subunit epsilon